MRPARGRSGPPSGSAHQAVRELLAEGGFGARDAQVLGPLPGAARRLDRLMKDLDEGRFPEGD
ncbi:hypothetical protein ACWC5G_11705, partial [Streptomyces sp. NPDC001274]